MSTTTKPAHLRLVSSRDPADAGQAADAYLAAFRQSLDAFLAVETLATVRVEGALRAVSGEPCLSLVIHEPGQDAIVNTKIFAAVQATTTYLSVTMDGTSLGAGWTWGDVRMETRFVAAAATKATGRLRAL